MGDLASDSERVPMEGHDSSFICEDDKVLLEEALPPAGQTLCSCGELHHSQDGTHEQCMNGDSVENEVDISGSRSSGIKRGKGSGGNSQGFSECSEPKVKKIYNKSRKTSHPSSAPESLMSDARASGRRPLVPSVACEVKQFNWLQRNIMCMGVDTHKGQYEAYRQLHDMAHAQQVILHHVSGASGPPPTPTTPTPYAQWNTYGLNYGNLEHHLFPALAREPSPAAVAADDEGDEDEDDYEE